MRFVGRVYAAYSVQNKVSLRYIDIVVSACGFPMYHHHRRCNCYVGVGCKVGKGVRCDVGRDMSPDAHGMCFVNFVTSPSTDGVTISSSKSLS